MTSFLIVSIVLFLVWLTFFFFSEETRREQIIMSMVGAIVAPGILTIVAVDYRNILVEQVGSIGIEDFIFTFSLFGIAAVAYQAILGKHLHRYRGDRIKITHPVIHLLTHLILLLALWAFVSLLLVHVFELESIRSLIVGGVLMGTYIIADRHDLLLNALVSGIFLALLILIIEQFFFVRLNPVDAATFWQWNAISPLLIGGVPLEEIIWSAVVGFAVGPLYEWLRRYEVR